MKKPLDEELVRKIAKLVAPLEAKEAVDHLLFVLGYRMFNADLALSTYVADMVATMLELRGEYESEYESADE